MGNFAQRLKRLEGKLPEKKPRWFIFEIAGYLDQSVEKQTEINALCYEKYPEAKQAAYVIFLAGPPHNYECSSDFSFDRDVSIFNKSL